MLSGKKIQPSPTAARYLYFPALTACVSTGFLLKVVFLQALKQLKLSLMKIQLHWLQTAPILIIALFFLRVKMRQELQ